MRKLGVAFILIATCAAPIVVEAQASKERGQASTASSTRSPLNIKRAVERAELESLAAYFRANPKDERFRVVEAEIEAAPLIEMDFLGTKSYSKLADVTKTTLVEKDSGKVLITVLGAKEQSEAKTVGDAVRWGLVKAKDVGVAKITEGSTVPLGGGDRTRSARMLEVSALAARFNASVVMFTSAPTDGVEAKDLIVDVRSATPKPQ